MIKKIVVISFIHIVIVTIAIIGSSIIGADAIRSGIEEWPLSGKILQTIAQILTQPARSTVLGFIAKDSNLFWPILMVNSLVWGVVISFLLKRLSPAK